MVVAEGMGDEHCQASGAEKSHRRTGTTARRDYASHGEWWNRVPRDKGNGADNLSDERQTVGATIQRNDVPRGTMDETSSLWTLVSIALPRSVRESDTPGKGSCDRERYPWFVAQFWTESRNRWRCRFRAADPRPHQPFARAMQRLNVRLSLALDLNEPHRRPARRPRDRRGVQIVVFLCLPRG